MGVPLLFIMLLNSSRFTWLNNECSVLPWLKWCFELQLQRVLYMSATERSGVIITYSGTKWHGESISFSCNRMWRCGKVVATKYTGLHFQFLVNINRLFIFIQFHCHDLSGLKGVLGREEIGRSCYYPWYSCLLHSHWGGAQGMMTINY